MLQEYEINWEYIPGRKNVVADILSRINLDAVSYTHLDVYKRQVY